MEELEKKGILKGEMQLTLWRGTRVGQSVLEEETSSSVLDFGQDCSAS